MLLLQPIDFPAMKPRAAIGQRMRMAMVMPRPGAGRIAAARFADP
jgi:hypothetical protein